MDVYKDRQTGRQIDKIYSIQINMASLCECRIQAKNHEDAHVYIWDSDTLPDFLLRSRESRKRFDMQQDASGMTQR